MFEKVNLEDVLHKSRQTVTDEEGVLAQVNKWFTTEWEREQDIQSRIKERAGHGLLPSAEGLNPDLIFELKHIKSICLKYRLRFLPSSKFKGEIPTDAVWKTKELENAAGTAIRSFMIVAPARRFKLEDANIDPLLFAPLSDGRYYLIHKWGNDLAWYRSILAWPSASLKNLIALIVLVSLLAAAVVPTQWLSGEGASYFNFYRVAFAVWNLAFLSGMVSYFWCASGAKFGAHAWKSPHFN